MPIKSLPNTFKLIYFISFQIDFLWVSLHDKEFIFVQFIPLPCISAIPLKPVQWKAELDQTPSYLNTLTVHYFKTDICSCTTIIYSSINIAKWVWNCIWDLLRKESRIMHSSAFSSHLQMYKTLHWLIASCQEICLDLKTLINLLFYWSHIKEHDIHYMQYISLLLLYSHPSHIQCILNKYWS